GRSRRRGHDDYDMNAQVYAASGAWMREMLLGDGIEGVQTTSTGLIWASYFDEGVFGNNGWRTPVGASGLVAWDSNGTKCYEFQPPVGLDRISDCYAMNVDSDETVWCYYYTGFPLVRIRQQRVEHVWSMPLCGSRAFAVWRDYALFCGTYDERDLFHL